jgi:hypothetical protein
MPQLGMMRTIAYGFRTSLIPFILEDQAMPVATPR